MFFKKDKDENNDLSKVAALLIHAAKIDENFSKSEEIIIKQALLQIGANNKNLEKNNEVYFKYIPKKKVKSQNKENIRENPFGVLKDLNLN